jgi:hypothetical protein
VGAADRHRARRLRRPRGAGRVGDRARRRPPARRRRDDAAAFGAARRERAGRAGAARAPREGGRADRDAAGAARRRDGLPARAERLVVRHFGLGAARGVGRAALVRLRRPEDVPARRGGEPEGLAPPRRRRTPCATRAATR